MKRLAQELREEIQKPKQERKQFKFNCDVWSRQTWEESSWSSDPVQVTEEWSEGVGQQTCEGMTSCIEKRYGIIPTAYEREGLRSNIRHIKR